MVEGHVVADAGLRWTLTLRPGLLFHDGEPVLARDAVASIRRWGARDAFGLSLLAATEALTALDDRRIEFRLKHPFPLLAYALGKAGSPICAIMPERLTSTDPFRQVTEMAGSGPFHFLADERVAGARVAYARFERYRPRGTGSPSFIAGPKRAFVDCVEWQVLPDAATAAAALRAREVDWWEAPTFDLLPLLARDRGIRITVPDPTGYIGIMRMNHLQPPFDDPAIRRAILPALSQADFMAAVTGEAADAARTDVGFFCPETPMASTAGLEAITGPRSLPQAALKAAGYRGERVVVMAPTDFPTLMALGDVGADLLKRIGFNVDYQAMDWGSLLQRNAKQDPVEQGGWSVFHTYWSGLDMLNPAVNSSLRANGTAAGKGWPPARPSSSCAMPGSERRMKRPNGASQPGYSARHSPTCPISRSARCWRGRPTAVSSAMF
ncbi:peptide/nickel transport system substrate-binding protein [Belnapia rosea]|nr:peptide/nickel transport system substrate-binding protein [Belnapia rosea]